MIRNLEIENFKSIKHLKLDCRRINLFIGEPNTGKSNILETLGILSFGYGGIGGFVRFENMSNLFCDENLDDNIEIRTDGAVLGIEFEEGKFKGLYRDGEQTIFGFDYDYNGSGSTSSSQAFSPFRIED